MSAVYRSPGGYLATDCPICGQEVRVDLHGDRRRFNCRGGCSHYDVKAALDPQVISELGDGLHGDAPAQVSTLTDFTDITAKPIVWLWQHRIAFGKITALAGRPKVGKGFFYSQLISAVTRGRLDGLEGPSNVILVTTEDEPGDTLKPRLLAAGADPARVSFFQMGSPDEPVPFRVPQDTDELARRVAEKDAALVVIDPLVEFIDGKVDSHKSHPVRQAIASINGVVRAPAALCSSSTT
jgi:AAA domain